MAEVILKNYADVAANYEGEALDFRSNEVSTTIVRGLSATKTANKTFWVNGLLEYTITVTNDSGVELTGGHLVDDLDASIITLDQTSGVFVNDVPVVFQYSANRLTVQLPDLADGESAVVKFYVKQV